jgi:hypothetical protein
MSHILIEGYAASEILALSSEELEQIVFHGEPIVFTAGSAKVLGRFKVNHQTLAIELAQVEGGGEGALLALSTLASKYAEREHLEFIEWRVHAVHCAQPNLKLRRVLEKRGFQVRTIDGVGECYWMSQAIQHGGAGL